jgi:hypothetical protein
MTPRLTSTRPSGRRSHSRAPHTATLPKPALADQVCDAGMGSFPASDPPSWSPLRVGRPPRDHTDPVRA